MTQTKYENEHINIELTAHEDAEGRLLVVRATAAERLTDQEEPPLSLSIVIDRSGSMSGAKLKVAKQAASKLVESLRPVDRVGVVVYDDDVDTLFRPAQPSPSMARSISAVDIGGCTNLHGGWHAGCRLLEKGGRVLLLSDGLANAGEFTDAESLARESRRYYERHGIATSTVGIGSDYDESLMAGMAREGGGFHYYASTAESIMEAFSRERFLIRSLAVAEVKIQFGETVVSLGQLLEGESKVVVARVDSLTPAGLLTYLDCKTETRVSEELRLPTAYGTEPKARAYELVELAAELMDKSGVVRSSEQAKELLEATREILGKVLNHPLSDEEPLKSLTAELEQKIDRLRQLSESYDEHSASLHRKVYASMGFNMREPGKAHSSVAEKRGFVSALRSEAYRDSGLRECDGRAFSLRPKEFWLNWPAVPLSVSEQMIRVGLVDPFDGFAVASLTRELGMRVVPDKRAWSEDEIARALRD